MQKISCRLFLLVIMVGMACASFADFPLISQRYLADPDGLEYNGRLYLFCSGDDDNAIAGGYTMHSIACISTDDLKNWTDHGVVFQVPANAAWAGYAWAPTIAYRNGLFYLYFGNNTGGIGVATNASPTGPFVDARGSALVSSSTSGAAGTNQWYFDPSIFVDSDGQAYLYFGGDATNNARVVLLNPDMINLASPAAPVGVAPLFLEASQMHKRNGIYYFSYATGGAAGEWIKYMTNSYPASGFTPVGNVLQAPNNNNNNHQAFLTFQGLEYVAYHNRYLSTQNGLATNIYKRNVCLDNVIYNADGTIQAVVCTTNGLAQLKYLNPYILTEAEIMAQQNGIYTEPCAEGGMDVTSITNGDWTMVRGVNFGPGATNFTARVASAAGGGNIELHLDGLTGTLVGTCVVPVTGGTQTWASVSCPVNAASAQGTHDLYLKYTGGSGTNLFNFNWWQFKSVNPPPPAPAGLNAAAATTSRIDLSWTASPGAASYNVKRATVSGGPYAAIANGVAGNSCSDNGVISGTTYYYIVSAVTTNGESANSSQVVAVPLPAAPTKLAAIRGTNQVVLSWAAPAGANTFNVKRGIVSGGPYTNIAGGVTLNSYNDLTAAGGTTYFYVVSALNGFGESSNSAEAATSSGVATAFEAEAGTLGADFAVSNSSSPIYIVITSNNSSNSPTSSARVGTYTITFPSAGTYQLYARVWVGVGGFNDDSLFYGDGFGTKSPTNNSDWVLVNGLAGVGFTNKTDVVTGGGTLGNQVWKWVNLSQLTARAGFAVGGGQLTQIFQIGGREDGLYLDKFAFGSTNGNFTVAQLDAIATNAFVNNSCTVDWNDSYQRIDGFGGGVVFLDAGLDPISDTNADTLFKSANTNQLGLTLMRVRIAPNSSWVSSFSAWGTSLADAQKAVARGARVLATPWTPPAAMKDNNNTVSGSVLPSQYASFANYLNTYANYMRTSGVQLAAISIQNEPDFDPSYEGCLWTWNEFQPFFHNYAGAITSAPVMMPESFYYDFNLSDPTLNDAIAATNVAVVGGHLYGGTIQNYSNAHSKSKPTWMTEYLINDQTWPSAMSTAQQISDCLTVGNMSAYIWWKCLGDTNGLVSSNGVPQKRGFVMSQFSRFVLPGYFRIGANSAGQAQISSFKGPNGAFAIVAVNGGGTDITQTFTFTNCVVTNSITPWMTTSNVSLAVQSPVAVANSTFSYTLPAMSVVTFVGKIGAVPPVFNAITLFNGKANLWVNGPSNYDYTLLTSTNLIGWQPLLTTNLSTLPYTLVDTNSATNRTRFYRLQLGQ
jgi:arabinoxylan arabinofuranohydrolase